MFKTTQAARKAAGYQMKWADYLQDEYCWEVYEGDSLWLGNLICVCPDKVTADKILTALEAHNRANEVAKQGYCCPLNPPKKEKEKA